VSSVSSHTPPGGALCGCNILWYSLSVVQHFAMTALDCARKDDFDGAQLRVQDGQRALDVLLSLRDHPLISVIPARYDACSTRAQEMFDGCRSAIKFLLLRRDDKSWTKRFVFFVSFARHVASAAALPPDDTAPLSSLVRPWRQNSLLARLPDKTLPCSWLSVPADFFSAAVRAKLDSIDKDLATCAVGVFTPRSFSTNLIPCVASFVPYSDHMAHAVKDTSEASRAAFCRIIKEGLEVLLLR